MLGDSKTFGQIPNLTAALRNGLVQIIQWDQLSDSPFVCTILMTLPVVNGSVYVVEAAGDAVTKLMPHVDALFRTSIPDGIVDTDKTSAVFKHDGHRAIFTHRVLKHLYILLFCQIMEKLIFDTGVKEYKINGNGVLRFNPSDPNLYARFMDAMEKIQAVEEKLVSRAKK